MTWAGGKWLATLLFIASCGLAGAHSFTLTALICLGYVLGFARCFCDDMADIEKRHTDALDLIGDGQ